MSMGYGEQADPWDWGENCGQDTQQNTDSNNCWVQQHAQAQNYNYQQYSKGTQQHNEPQVNRTHSSADYFDSMDLRINSQSLNSGQNYALHQGQKHPTWNQPTLYHQSPVFTSERINNNTVVSSSAEVENREIAPPDSKPPKNMQVNFNQPPQESYDGRQNIQPPPPVSQFVSQQPMTINNMGHQGKLLPSSFAPVGSSSPLVNFPPPVLNANSLPPPPIQELSDQNIHLVQNNTGTISDQKNPPLFHQNTSGQHPPGFYPPPISQVLPFSNSDSSVNVHRFTPPPQNPLGPGPNNHSAPQYQNPSQWNPLTYPPPVPSGSILESENTPAVSAPNNYNNQNWQNNSTSLRRSSSPGYAPPNPPSEKNGLRHDNQNIPDNQERIPENRERLDNTEDVRHQISSLSLNQQAEGTDIQQHCSVDRNQYLETGQLSNVNNNVSPGSANIEITDEGDAPPPGLHRLVTGQGCENQEQLIENQVPGFSQPEPSTHDSTRHSTPLSSIGEPERCGHSEADGDRLDGGSSHGGSTRRREGQRLVPGQSVGEEPPPAREVPGEAQPLHGRVVLGQMGGRPDLPPPQDTTLSRGEMGRERERDRDSERMERMVVGELRSKQLQNSSNAPDDYRSQHRGRPRHRRESSYEEDERDYSTDREKRHEDYRRRDERHRRRRDHRSPEYRSDEEYDDRRGYSRRERRSHERDYSPEYYRDYYRDRRPRRHMDHYPREYDDYYYRENRSRPSSRTGSDYRRSTIEYQQRHPRQHFYPEPSISAGPYVDYNMSQRAFKDYCEMFRRTDPINYRLWYDQYVSGYNVTQPASYSNDRASVHSGQSSSDQRQNVPIPQDTTVDSAVPVDETGINEDFTPRLYPAPHVRGKIDGQGNLIIVNPNDPMDGQRATVHICKIEHSFFDPDIAEFLECPGPFISGLTHRNTVLQYLKRMSDRSESSSEKLLYDLVHLTVKGNGVVNGSDVAELLMDSYKCSSQEGKGKHCDSNIEPISEAEVISRFRELLQQGNKTEALEWAMEHKAWGHALFLASKMDDRTHNSIMLRFANSLQHNDPLQTLYQLMSGNVPQASTYCADKNWSDWRPHLAMILSNPTNDVSLNRKAIITLGDSLGAGGRIFASHFCYLTAQVNFSSFKPDAKLVLLGSSSNQEFSKFATCRAIMLSLCYEYGLKLYPSSKSVPTFQIYKLLLASRLIDHDRNQTALQYCELLAKEVVQPDHYDHNIASTVIDVATRLKMMDPTVALSGDPEKEPDWLVNLKQFHELTPLRKDDDERNSLSHGFSNSTLSETGQDCNHDNLPFQQVPDPAESYIAPIMPQDYAPTDMPQNVYIPSQTQSSSILSPEILTIDNHNQPQQQHYQQQPYLQPEQMPPNEFNGYRIDANGGSQKLWGNGNIAILDSYRPQNDPQLPQQVAKPGFSYYKASEEQLKPKEDKEETKMKEVKNAFKNKKNEEPTSGWFGGIWEKFRPKNQMRLPDDNNPRIVWNQEQKRWVNLDGDEEDKPEIKAPPRASDLTLAQRSAPIQSTNAPIPNQQAGGVNKYKMQKGKLKPRYVDVMGGTPRTAQGSNDLDGLIPVMPNPPANTNLFVPPPVDGGENAPINFITPGNITVSDNQQEANKEVKSLDPVPTMYNPASFTT